MCCAYTVHNFIGFPVVLTTPYLYIYIVRCRCAFITGPIFIRLLPLLPTEILQFMFGALECDACLFWPKQICRVHTVFRTHTHTTNTSSVGNMVPNTPILHSPKFITCFAGSFTCIAHTDRKHKHISSAERITRYLQIKGPRAPKSNL